LKSTWNLKENINNSHMCAYTRAKQTVTISIVMYFISTVCTVAIVHVD
jgi:hypothetical protein